MPATSRTAHDSGIVKTRSARSPIPRPTRVLSRGAAPAISRPSEAATPNRAPARAGAIGEPSNAGHRYVDDAQAHRLTRPCIHRQPTGSAVYRDRAIRQVAHDDRVVAVLGRTAGGFDDERSIQPGSQP